MRIIVTATLSALILSLCLHSASAAPITIISDDFTDGSLADTGGTQASWFKANSGITTTIATDDGSPGIGGGNALNFAHTADFVGVAGVFSATENGTNYDAVSLATVGDKLRLTLNFRLTENPAGASNNVRFGLLNNGATPLTADFGNATGVSNHTGYFVSVGTGGNPSGSLSYDTVNASLLTGGPVAISTPAIAVNDLNPHSLMFELERTGASQITIRAQLDGGTIHSTTNGAQPLVTTYHEIALALGGGNPDMRIDNALLVYTPVPEPSSFALVGLGAVGLVVLRRFRWAK